MKMKKVFSLGVVICALCCLFTISAFAVNESTDNEVGIIIEDVSEHLINNPYLLEANPYINHANRAATVINLNSQTDTLYIGTMSANATYTTNIYNTPNGKIKIALESYSHAAKHLKVTLYKSGTSVSVAESTLSLPTANPAGGSTGKAITFTNLTSANNYYAIIKNVDTITTGYISGLVKKG